MKKQLSGLSIYIFMLVAVAGFTAFTFQEKNKGNKKEQAQDKKAQNRDNQDKARENKNGKANNNAGNQKDDRGKNDKNEGKGKNEDKEKGNADKDNMDRGNSGKNNGKNAEYGYNWDRENFKDRDKLRKHEKVTICHKFDREGEPGVTISVSANALKAHLDHGDARGDCPEVDNTRYSNSFLERRRDYFNLLQEEQEQVLYSRSILDYALQRLSSSRLQLATLQTNNAAPEEIERKKVMIVELEQNASTLETLLGVAAGLLANKWVGDR